MTINILSSQQVARRNFNDFYPLFKWKDIFKGNGISFNFFKHHFHPKITFCDVLIIDYRYFMDVIRGNYSLPDNKTFENDHFIIDFVQASRKSVGSIILFDSGDGGNSPNFHLTPYFDRHLRKQLYTDTSKYTNSRNYNFLPWIPENAGIKETARLTFKPLDTSELGKLGLSWNIGLCDYRNFPLKKKWIPINTAYVLPATYRHLDVVNPKANRKFTLSYRGASNRFPGYDYMRNKALQKAIELKIENVLAGNKVPYPQYMAELKQSIFAFSPFGWGEICYRDFEIFMNGNVLIKPNMDHLQTFPNFFETGTTYLPVRWDLEDLEKTLQEGMDKLEYSTQIAKQAQERFLFFQNSGDHFFAHFKKQFLS